MHAHITIMKDNEPGLDFESEQDMQTGPHKAGKGIFQITSNVSSDEGSYKLANSLHLNVYNFCNEGIISSETLDAS